MALKRATYFTYGDDALCAETQKFVEESGVVLDLRDIEKKPLTVDELNRIIGHISIIHFLNTFSDSYTKYNLDRGTATRSEILELMSQDHTLIRRPILKSTRLMIVGCDRRKIAEMLQVNVNGNGNGNGEDKPKGGMGNSNNRRASEQAAAGK